MPELGPGALVVISEDYLRLNQLAHQQMPDYGVSGQKHIGLVSELIAATGAQSLLDYGAGKETLGAGIRHLVDYRAYDPAIPHLAAAPEPADLVACTDVMEHVEPEYVDEVLRHIAELARCAVVFSIACEVGNRCLPDGTPAHRSVHAPEWWRAKLEQLGAVESRPSVSRYREAVFILRR